MLLFYEKWLQDIAAEQREDGAIPDTAHAVQIIQFRMADRLLDSVQHLI